MLPKSKGEVEGVELFEGLGDPYIHQNTKFINTVCYTQIPTLVIKVFTKYSLLS